MWVAGLLLLAPQGRVHAQEPVAAEESVPAQDQEFGAEFGQESEAPQETGRPLPSAAELARMRETLQARQRERQSGWRTEELVPLTETAERIDLPVDRDISNAAVLRVRNEMETLRALVTLTPADGAEAATGGSAATAEESTDGIAGRTVRFPVVLKGNQLIPLEPGDWTLSITVGYPNGTRPLTLPDRELRLRRGRLYALDFTRQAGSNLARELRPTEQAAAEE